MFRTVPSWSPLRAALAACLLLPLGPAGGSAQGPGSLYTPRTVKQALAAHTRSPDGRPGAAYWQNHGRYQITLDVRPPDPTVRGTETITYINNSPDSLPALVFKLFLNSHKAGAVRNGPTGGDGFIDGVQIDQFTVGGTAATWRTSDRTGTWQQVRLPRPLAPHDSVRMTVTWHVELATSPGREGIIDPRTWYLAYFYPRVAVYDDIDGWDRMDFNGGQEFYSDFNDYDVTIRAPRNFVVWGTGTLTNAAEVLSPDALARYTASLTATTPQHIATSAQMAAHTITAQDSVLAWRFVGQNIPDVAFGLSDHYAWDGGSTVVDPATGRRASVQAAYADSTIDYPHMVTFAGDALAWLSRHWPGVPYPYEKTTVFQGYADMEYPMMVNDNTVADTAFARFVAAHELAHTWFPFYMGINESRYAFMDEGWATTFEYLYNQATMGPDKATALYQQFRVARWINDPSPLGDLPIITPADVVKGAAYGNNAYGKASLGYLALKDMLGDQVFGRALHAFVDRWHGKHPIPWDFFNTVNDVTGESLNWFWTSWYFDNSYIDLAIDGVATRSGRPVVTVRNVGGMPAPFDLTVTWTDGTTTTLHQTPRVWQQDPTAASVVLPAGRSVRSVTMEGGIWMDADTTTNRWPRAS